MHALSTTHPMSKITRLAISRKPVNQKKKKKKGGRDNIFLHLYTGFGVKIENTHCYRNSATFLTSWQSALNSPPNSPTVIYSKFQNRLSKAPMDTPMDRFLMQYINNKCTLILRESVKKVVLDFRRTVAPPYVFWIGKQIGP